MKRKIKIATAILASSVLFHLVLDKTVKRYHEMYTVTKEIVSEPEALREIPKVFFDMVLKKNAEKKEGFYRVDFHAHMNKKGSYASIEEVFSTLTKKVDMVVITNHFPPEENQLSYQEIKKLVWQHKGDLHYVDDGNIFCLSNGEKELYFIKGQEVGTIEGFHVIVIGKEITEVMNLEKLISVAEAEGIAIISHPYSVPRTGLLNKEKENLLIKNAPRVSAIESFNASNTLWISISNVKAKQLAKRYNLATVAGSDMHHEIAKVGMACAYIKKGTIDFATEKTFLDSLEKAIRENTHENHEEYCSPLELYKDFFNKTEKEKCWN